MLKETKGYVLICDCCGEQYETIDGYSSLFGWIDCGLQGDKFACETGDWEQCIPFEGNEHLLGTTDMCDEQYINW